MTLAAHAAMPTVVGMAAKPSTVATTAPGNGLAMRAFLRRRKNHSSKGKGYSADKHQQQDSEVHPSGCGHLSLDLFPRLGRQFNSTTRM